MFQYVELIYQYIKDNYNLDHELVDLKLRHTFRVYRLMIELAEKLNLNNHDARLSLFIALFHDLGRFYEVLKNNKFNNVRFDHADASVQILFNDGLIKKFPIDEDDYEIIRKAVFYHNKKDIPKDLKDKEKFFCYMIRDVDKIDILHVIAKEEKKSFKYIPTEVILKNFYNKELIDLKDIGNKSDTIVLYLAWQDQLVFKESKEILYQKGYLDELINSIDILDNILNQDIFNHLIDEVYNHRDDYLYKNKVLRKEVNYERIRKKI